ncbi:hypothetical protein TNCV_4426741 [Trichonephila clavipes]|nr:hypothetical protein TNCV_4426741 [Trichonephila clavipes]
MIIEVRCSKIQVLRVVDKHIGDRLEVKCTASSYVNPTPLAHADTSRDVLPRGGTSQPEPGFVRYFCMSNSDHQKICRCFGTKEQMPGLLQKKIILFFYF